MRITRRLTGGSPQSREHRQSLDAAGFEIIEFQSHQLAVVTDGKDEGVPWRGAMIAMENTMAINSDKCHQGAEFEWNSYSRPRKLEVSSKTRTREKNRSERFCAYAPHRFRQGFL